MPPPESAPYALDVWSGCAPARRPGRLTGGRNSSSLAYSSSSATIMVMKSPTSRSAAALPVFGKGIGGHRQDGHQSVAGQPATVRRLQAIHHGHLHCPIRIRPALIPPGPGPPRHLRQRRPSGPRRPGRAWLLSRFTASSSRPATAACRHAPPRRGSGPADPAGRRLITAPRRSTTGTRSAAPPVAAPIPVVPPPPACG